MHRVRELYEGVNLDEFTKAMRKEHRERTLQNNPDVLFRRYRRTKLHTVIFRPSDPWVWISVIRSRITTNLSLQLTKKRPVNDIFTITLSGSEKELESFCEGFQQMYAEVMKNVQENGGAAAQENPEDDVEELRKRIRELELEIKKLQKK